MTLTLWTDKIDSSVSRETGWGWSFRGLLNNADSLFKFNRPLEIKTFLLRRLLCPWMVTLYLFTKEKTLNLNIVTDVVTILLALLILHDYQLTTIMICKLCYAYAN